MILAPALLTLLYICAFHLLVTLRRGWPPAHTTQPQLRRRLRVAVVGAGLSGVVTVKELAAKGHDVVCLDGGSGLGGAFNTHAYDSCHLSVSNHW